MLVLCRLVDFNFRYSLHQNCSKWLAQLNIHSRNKRVCFRIIHSKSFDLLWDSLRFFFNCVYLLLFSTSSLLESPGQFLRDICLRRTKRDCFIRMSPEGGGRWRSSVSSGPHPIPNLDLDPPIILVT